MNRPRTVAPVLDAPTHSSPSKPCLTMTETAIHTVTLGEAGSFAAIVHSNPGPDGAACIVILDEDEVEAHIALLRNAVADAKRIDAGLPPHARAEKGSTH